MPHNTATAPRINAQAFLSRSKVANPTVGAPAPAVAPVTPTVEPNVELANREALRQVLSATMLGGALGFGGRAMIGLPQMLRSSQFQHVPLPPGGPTTVEMSYEQDKKKPTSWVSAPTRQLKVGADGVTPTPITPPAAPAATMPPTPGPVGGITDAIYDNVVKPSGMDALMSSPGSRGTNPASKWWRNGAMLTGGLGAGYAGWRLADWLTKSYQDNEWARELDDAEHDYLTSMKSLHSGKVAELKRAADAPLPTPQAAPAMAPTPTPAPPPAQMSRFDAQDWPGWFQNHSLGMALMSGIPTGILAYNYVRDNSNNKALREALLLRQRLQHHRQASPVQLVPEKEPI